MAGYQLIVIIVLIIQLFILINISKADLPRTKTALHRSLNKNRRGARFNSEDVADSVSNVYSENMIFGHITPETFGCAVFSSVLVGLSGIFPLLVIPLEAGPALKHGAAAERLKLLLSFAVGALLGDVFLHLLPEAWAHLDKNSGHEAYTKIGLWVITGILMFLIIEKIFGDKEDNETRYLQHFSIVWRLNFHAKLSRFIFVKGILGFSIFWYSIYLFNVTSQLVTYIFFPLTKDNVHTEETKSGKNNGEVIKSQSSSEKNLIQRKHKAKEHVSLPNGRPRTHSFSTVSKINVTGYLNLFANVIDNFTHGLAVGGSYLVSRKVGIVTTIAILLHEIPHEIGDFAILLKSGFNRWKAAKAQLLTASGGVIGALTALSAESPEAAGNRTAWILPFTSGGFLYIALVTVVPELLQEKKGIESIKQVICLISGVFSMVLVTILFEE